MRIRKHQMSLSKLFQRIKAYGNNVVVIVILALRTNERYIATNTKKEILRITTLFYIILHCSITSSSFSS